MQVLPGPGYEVLVQVVKSWWNTRKLFLHHRDQVLSDLIYLIFSKKVGNLHSSHITAKGEFLRINKERYVLRYFFHRNTLNFQLCSIFLSNNIWPKFVIPQ